MSEQSYTYDTLPLSDEEVTLLRSILEQFSLDSDRIVERLIVQSNNPRIGENNRCIYVLTADDIEAVKTALQTAIETATTSARSKPLRSLLQWVHEQTDDMSVS